MVVRCPGAMHSCDGAAWQRRQARTTATRPDTTYNLKYRNCSSSVSRALEAAIEGASARVWGGLGGGRPFLRGMTAPELWVAAQLRERAATMAWTPGLTLDYARALSMLADPRPSGWVKMARLAVRRMVRSRQQWREEERSAPATIEPRLSHSHRATWPGTAHAQVRRSGENSRRIKSLPILPGSYAQPSEQKLGITLWPLSGRFACEV